MHLIGWQCSRVEHYCPERGSSRRWIIEIEITIGARHVSQVGTAVVLSRFRVMPANWKRINWGNSQLNWITIADCDSPTESSCGPTAANQPVQFRPNRDFLPAKAIRRGGSFFVRKLRQWKATNGEESRLISKAELLSVYSFKRK